jgi:signal peptidase II
MPSPHIKPWIWGPLSATGMCVALLVVAVDQLHKWWMLKVYRIEALLEALRAQQKTSVSVAPFLDLTYVINSGVSYGLFPMSSRTGQWLLVAFAVLASLGMAIWLARGVTSKLVAASLGLIIGGALSNAIDRLYLGGVADFFQPHAFGFYWRWVFNIADMAIVAGVIGLLYDSVGLSRKDASKAL